MPDRTHQTAAAPARHRLAGALLTPVGVSLVAHGAAAGVLMGVLGAAGAPASDKPIASALISLPLRAPAPPAGAPPTPEREARAGDPADMTAVTAPGVGLPPIAERDVAEALPAESRALPVLGAPAASLAGALHAGQTGVSFAGLTAVGARARSVVYVVDASGPMVTSLPWVIAEVQRSIDALAPTQRFGVVLFQDTGTGARVRTFDARLNDATTRQRARLAAWLAHAAPSGKSSPLDGLRAALALRPQVIFLLSRSIARSGGGEWGDGLDATLRELDRLNPINPATGERPVLIRTIQFLEPDPTGTMQAIARAHGGAASTSEADRVIERAELGLP